MWLVFFGRPEAKSILVVVVCYVSGIMNFVSIGTVVLGWMLFVLVVVVSFSLIVRASNNQSKQWWKAPPKSLVHGYVMCG